VTCSSETSVDFQQTARCHIQDNRNLQKSSYVITNTAANMISSVCPRSNEAVLSVCHQISALTLATTEMSSIRELSHNWFVSSIDVKKES
jgi:hypothetical protein